MSKDEIQKIARNCLARHLNSSGSILYSSHETLMPGPVYLIGFNPGGVGGNTIASSIDLMMTNTSNAYLDESWENRAGEWPIGEAPLQRRVKYILDGLGLNPRDVCASNLIFLQSRKASDISYSVANECWPVHEAILKVVKPKLIICSGNSELSAYGYLKRLLSGVEESSSSGHGSWKIKGFESKIDNTSVYVSGLPHLSRYSPFGKPQVINWLAEKI